MALVPHSSYTSACVLVSPNACLNWCVGREIYVGVIFTTLELTFPSPLYQNTGYRTFVNASKPSRTMSESGKGSESNWSSENTQEPKQKMMKKLKELGMYEEGMSVSEMSSLLKVVQESITQPGGQHKNINETQEPKRQDNQPCYSQVLTSKTSDRESMSPELSAHQMRKSLPQETRGESGDEAIFSPQSRNSFGKEDKDAQKGSVNKMHLSINENSSEAIDNKQSTQRTNSLIRNHETPKGKFNPLNALLNENDVPLQPRYRALPEKDSAEVGTSVNIDKAVAKLSNRLQQIAEFQQSKHRSSVTYQYTWGKAIQVGTDNGSLDKEFVPVGTSEDAGPSDINVDTERRRRFCARRVDYTAGNVSGSNSDDDFELASSSKRRKSTKRAGSSENTSLSKDASSTETPRRRSYFANRDDIYEWEVANEEENSDEELWKSAKKKKPTKRADSSEKICPLKESAGSETSRRRRNIFSTDDTYEWEAANEEENSDEELRKSAKKKKPTKRADSSEKICPLKESAGSETSRRRRNIFSRDDTYKWEAANEEENSDEELRKSAKKKKPTKRADSSEKMCPLKESAGNETSRRRRNIFSRDDTYEREAANEEENSDEELEKVAKRKKRTISSAATKKVATMRTSIEPVSSNVLEKQDDAPVSIDDSDEIMNFNNEDTSQTLQKSQRSRSEEAVSSTSSSYPRRIVPPIPKGKWSGIRARKPLFGAFDQTRGKIQLEQDTEDCEKVARTNRKVRGNNRMRDTEIAEASENVDEDEVISAQADIVEIRPLRVSSRMKLQLEHLQSVRREEEQLELQRAEKQRIKEDQSRRDNEERIKERVREQKQKLRREEQAAKAKADSEIRWNTMLKQQGKKRQVERTELNPEGPRQNTDVSTVEVVQENYFETRNDDRRSGEQHSKRIPCPICGKKFSAGLEIEDHAASCEEFSATNSAGASRSNSPAVSVRSTTPVERTGSAKLYECAVCSAFSSNNGKKYEEHVNTCLIKHRDGVGSSTVIEVPDSPIRTLRRASEQTDSDINYRGQFVPKTRSHVNENRKRKRL